jgi:hypothetical protein
MPDLSGLEGLTGRGGDISAKVSFLREILPEYIDEGYSYAAALRDLRANDFKINTGLFYDLRRQIEGIYSSPQSIRNLPDSYYPAETSLGLNPERQDRQYKFIYTVTAEDSETGESYYQNFSLQMDSFGSIGELKQLGNQYLSEQYPQLAEQKTRIDLAYGLVKQQ